MEVVAGVQYAARSTHRWAPAARSISLGKVHAAPSRIVPYLLPRLVESDPAERWRDNYRMLLAELSRHVPPALSVLPDGASPYVFPGQTTDEGRG